MRYEAENQHIHIVTKIEPDLPDVMIDRKNLKQALLNIIKNAIAAMPEGGVLTISVEEKNDELQIAVSDTGIGIPEELMAKSSNLTSPPKRADRDSASPSHSRS